MVYEANFLAYQTGEVTLPSRQNPEEKTVVKVRPVRISTDRTKRLPRDHLVEYDKDSKEKRVTWDAVTADQVKDYHSLQSQVKVEGVVKPVK